MVARKIIQKADPCLTNHYNVKIVPHSILHSLLTLFDTTSSRIIKCFFVVPNKPLSEIFIVESASSIEEEIFVWMPEIVAGLCELLHALMLLYTGYPELYTSLLAVLPLASISHYPYYCMG